MAALLTFFAMCGSGSRYGPRDKHADRMYNKRRSAQKYGTTYHKSSSKSSEEFLLPKLIWELIKLPFALLWALIVLCYKCLKALALLILSFLRWLLGLFIPALRRK